MMHDGLLLVGAASGAVTGVGAVVAVTWKKIIKPLVKIEEALPTLHSIHQQFHNNGGSTIKDKLDAVDTKVDNIKRVIDVHVESAEFLNAHIMGRLTELENVRFGRRSYDQAIPAQRKENDDAVGA